MKFKKLNGKIQTITALFLCVINIYYISPASAITSVDLNSINNNTAFFDPTAISCSTDGATTGTSTSGSCCSGSSSITLSGANNEAQIYNYFTGRGLSPAQAAGIMGNLQTESGFQPERAEYGTWNGSTFNAGNTTPVATIISDGLLSWPNFGWGLPQWTSPGKMVTPTQAAGRNPDDLGTQLDFLWGQLYGKPGDLGTSSSESVVGINLKAATTPEAAADVFGYQYERFSGGSGGLRAAFARAIYVQFTTGAPLPPNATVPPVTSTCGGTTTTGGSSTISAYKNPYRALKDLQPDRIDGGIDMNGDGPIYAIGNGKITFIETGANDANSWYGNYIEYQLSDGEAAGKYVYFAEHCSPAPGITVGATVTSDTIICNMPADHTSTKGGPGAFSESGWGNASYGKSSYVDGCDYTSSGDNNWSSNCGLNFSRFMVKIGGPQAIVADGPSKLPLPGFPTWQ